MRADANVLTDSSPLPLEAGQRCRASLSPSSTRAMSVRASIPTRLPSIARSIVATCVTFTTEGRSRPPAPRRSRTLPGRSASRVFEVIAATVTEFKRDLLNRSSEITTAGRRFPGALPSGRPKPIHQTSPRATTPTGRCRSGLSPPRRGPLDRCRRTRRRFAP